MKKILIVDDEPVNLQLLRHALKDQYQLFFATSGQTAINATLEHFPDIILLDIMMPEMSGFETCEIIKSNPITQHIPIIFITALEDTTSEVKGFELGAVDFIHKPISPLIVRKRVATHLSLVRLDLLEQAHHSTLFMLGEAGHYNDTDTGDHVFRMAAFAKIMANKLGLTSEKQRIIELAAPMHDMGKIGIPDSILKAERALTPVEWEVMKKHCEIGAQILSKDPSKTPIFQTAREIALSHHEKWDGSGYPHQLKGDSIPLTAQIVAITDVFDALTSKRPYKNEWPVDVALSEIESLKGTHFSEHLVEQFFSVMPEILEVKRKIKEAS